MGNLKVTSSALNHAMTMMDCLHPIKTGGSNDIGRCHIADIGAQLLWSYTLAVA